MKLRNVIPPIGWALFVLILSSGTALGQCDEAFREEAFDDSEIIELSRIFYTDKGDPICPSEDSSHVMDIFFPPLAALSDCPDRPLFMFIPGGGFANEVDRGGFGRKMALAMARRGFVSAVIGYRANKCINTPNFPNDCLCFQDPFSPAQNCDNCEQLEKEDAAGEFLIYDKNWYKALQDSRAALEFLVQGVFPQHNLVLTNTFVMGRSAGAVTALHLAFTDNNDLTTYTASSPFPGTLGAIEDFIHTGLSNTTPHHIDGVIALSGAVADLNFIDQTDDTDMLLFHGSCDKTVSMCSYGSTCTNSTATINGSMEVHKRFTVDIANPNTSRFFVFDCEFNGHATQPHHQFVGVRAVNFCGDWIANQGSIGLNFQVSANNNAALPHSCP